MEEKGATIMGSTGTITLSQQQPVDLTNQVHHLPCCIKFTGPSDVAHYFKPRSSGFEADGLAVEEAHFRGRKLHGVTLPLPHGYSGHILGKIDPSKDKAKTPSRGRTSNNSSTSENHWETLAKCDNMTFWNHDVLPSREDTSSRLFHLFAVAKALHEPVTTEEMASASLRV